MVYSKICSIRFHEQSIYSHNKGNDIQLVQRVSNSYLHISSLYQLGHNPDISKLYLPIEFPVGRGTPMISPLLKWDHREDWFSLSFKPEDQPKVYSLIYSIDPRDSEWAYIKGHTIDGK